MPVAVEISMYPLDGDYVGHIRAFIDRLHAHAGLRIHTNQLSTQIWGEYRLVMGILTDEMAMAAGGAPQLVFVMKLLPGLAAPPLPPPA